MSEYRINPEHPTEVEVMHRGEWRVVYYSATPETALKCLERCKAQATEWSKLSPDERMLMILRTPNDPS